MNGMITIQNTKPERSHVVKHERVVINSVHSQVFLFEGSNMYKSRFKRQSPLCKCGCGEPVLKNKYWPYNWNRFIKGHQWNGKYNPMKRPEIKMMFIGENNPMKRSEVAKKVSETKKAQGINHPVRRIEVRKKISETLKGRKLPKNVCLKISNAHKGMKRSNETCKKISRALKGRKFSETHRQRLGIKASIRMKNGGAAYCNSFIQNPSNPQVKLFKKIQKIFPDATLNHPSLNFSIDIAIPDQMIAIEYDGSYWHHGRENYDRKRQQELESIGWKFLRYVDYVPKMNELRKDLNKYICQKNEMLTNMN